VPATQPAHGLCSLAGPDASTLETAEKVELRAQMEALRAQMAGA
jgi:hypothetical protein